MGSGSFGGMRGAGGGGSLNMGRQYPSNRTQANRGAAAGTANFTRQGNFVNDRHIQGIASEVVKQLRGQWSNQSNQSGNGGMGGWLGVD